MPYRRHKNHPKCQAKKNTTTTKSEAIKIDFDIKDIAI